MDFTNDVVCNVGNADQRKSWHNMKMQIKRQRNGVLTISNEWRLLSNYIKFYDANYFTGGSLSCSVFGSRHYSDKTCAFIPPEMASLFRGSSHGKKLPQGVFLDGRSKGKPYSCFIGVNGKARRIGRFETEEQAANAFTMEKSALILEKIAECKVIYKGNTNATKNLLRIEVFYK